MATKLQYATYHKPAVITSAGDALASLEEHVRSLEPENRRQQLEAAGLSFIAEHYDAVEASETAAEQFEELEPGEYDRFSKYFTRATPLAQYHKVPPAQVVTALSAARSSKLFTSLELRYQESTGETVVIGIINSKLGQHHYLVAQWGEVKRLTSRKLLKTRELPSLNLTAEAYLVRTAILLTACQLTAFLPFDYFWTLVLTAVAGYGYQLIVAFTTDNSRRQTSTINNAVSAFLVVAGFFWVVTVIATADI